jgi:GalNAc5-diNAcBac-PP-undecaprenol beta-1,3-glucosyltransferase
VLQVKPPVTLIDDSRSLKRGDSMPKVSVIVPTRNRSGLLARALRSVCEQSETDIEIIVVDDASEDGTGQGVAEQLDDRIRYLRLEQNLGPTGAKNAGLDAITGEWFTILDDDDEMVPDALSALLRVPDEIDASIDAVTCNCLDSQTGRYSGHGVTRDQWLDAETIARECEGEFWGLTRTALLGTDRFNPDLANEDMLWYRVNKRARRYYIHRALCVYHTEGDDRVCRRSFEADLSSRAPAYRRLMLEYPDYLEDLARWRPREHRRQLFNAVGSFVQAGDDSSARQAATALSRSGHGAVWWLARSGILFGSAWMTALRGAYGRLRRS